jgi:Asp-tRNA(Asn)/Glu-tRNA(Gln) amidotransferase A subunit family amidase
VHHGVAHFDTRRIAIEDDSAHFVLEDLDELRIIMEVILGPVNGGSKMPAQVAGRLGNLLFDKLPFGVQFIGRALNDQVVVTAAHSFQNHTDWHRQRPLIV